jgi:hypothetical protein
MEASLYDGYGTGMVKAWWFRWEDFSKPGLWSVTVSFLRFSHTVFAVVDDFGNLVEVK